VFSGRFLPGLRVKTPKSLNRRNVLFVPADCFSDFRAKQSTARMPYEPHEQQRAAGNYKLSHFNTILFIFNHTIPPPPEIKLLNLNPFKSAAAGN
jgi:hypothetical protein